MNCPKCGALNPVGAEYCNLCARSMTEKPKPPVTGPIEIPDVIRSVPAPQEAKGVRDLAFRGGIAAMAGGLTFLFTLGVMQAVGVTVFDFMFSTLGVSQTGLALFFFIIGLFSLISGGVGGNLEGKRDLVPPIRILAAMTGLGVWFGIAMALKPADAAMTVWLSDGGIGMVAALAAFPFAAAFLGLSESFDLEFEPEKAVYGALGGLGAGLIAAAATGLSMLSAPIFGSAAPAGFLAVAWFAIKVTVITGAVGFITGAALWWAIDATERRFQEPA
jgi:hypothetical protein